MTLAVRDLSVAYASPTETHLALRGVSLSVAPGEIVGVVGESGCGKSTLASSLIRLLPAGGKIVEGTMILEGVDLASLSEPELRNFRGNRISVVFQNPVECLHPLLTIGRQMVDIQHRSRSRVAEKLERAREMLARVGISEADRRLGQYVHQLSGGIVQRIALAMAMLPGPALIVADEPTANIDSALEARVSQLLKAHRKESGCSILLISHQLGLIERVCDAVVVMYAGEVVESGPVAEVFRRPRHPYTKLLLACDPARVAGGRLLPSIPGTPPEGCRPSAGCRFESRCSDAIDRCRTDAPELRSDLRGEVRCHRAEVELHDGDWREDHEEEKEF